MHLIIKHLASEFPEGNLRAISENTEKYVSASADVVNGMYADMSGKERVTKIELRFIDSLRCMGDSLDSLVGNLIGVSDFLILIPNTLPILHLVKSISIKLILFPDLVT